MSKIRKESPGRKPKYGKTMQRRLNITFPVHQAEWLATKDKPLDVIRGLIDAEIARENGK